MSDTFAPYCRATEPSVWPRAFARKAGRPTLHLEAPNPINFGAEAATAKVPVALVPPPDVLRGDRRPIVIPPQWPDEVTTSALPKTGLLAVPAADTFRYTSTKRARAKRDKERSRTARTSTPAVDASGLSNRRSLGGAKVASERKAGLGKNVAGTPGRDTPSNAAGMSGKRLTGHQIQLPISDPRVVQRN